MATTAASAQSVNSGSVTSTPPKVQTVTVKSTSQNLNTPDSFSVPSFDSSLGQLANVSVTLQTGSGNFQIFNSSNPTANFSGCTVSLQGSTGGGNVAINSFLSGTPNSSTPGSHTRGSSNGAPGSITNPNTSIPNFSPAIFDFWQDQSNGNVTLDFTNGFPTYPTSDFGHGLIPGTKARNTGTFTVTYTYITNTTATPEPSGSALTALAGLAAVALVIARRRNSSNA